jgi:hypothetical protein
MLFIKQVWCWKSILIILQSNRQFGYLKIELMLPQNCFWFGIALRKSSYEPTG